MDSKRIKPWVAMLLAILIALVPTPSAEAIGDSVTTQFAKEIINNNPEVAFTLTGIATEPEPMNVSSFSTADFMGGAWTNTDFALGAIPKTWAANPHDNSLGKTYNEAIVIHGTNDIPKQRFNFDRRSTTKAYSLPPEEQVITTPYYPASCTTTPANNGAGIAKTMTGGADLYGNRYAICNTNYFTKLDGNTGAPLWSFPLPLSYTDYTFYPIHTGLAFNADNTLGAFELVYQYCNSDWAPCLSDTWSGGYYLFNNLTGAFNPTSYARYVEIRDAMRPEYKGQLWNPSLGALGNMTLKFDIKYYSGDAKSDLYSFDPGLVKPTLFGMAFRMQDYRNMYRLEATKDDIKLMRIVNGVKSQMEAVTRPLTGDSWHSYRVMLSDGRIRVYEDGNLIMNKTDAGFTNGGFGPFTEKPTTQFRNVQFQWANADSSFETPGAAIVDTAVTYETSYGDPENDVRFDAGTRWKYDQIQTQRAIDMPLSAKLISATKFLDFYDGKSGIVPLTIVGGPLLSFSTVGLYKVDYQVPDTPHQSNAALAPYSEYSDWYTQYLVVHRRPLANFVLAQSPVDRTVTWVDYSFDPDRCYSHNNCQPEFSTTRGIYAKKFYYITPSGNRVDSKLVRPLESGTYTVAMAVQDEYKAWSDWYEQTLDIDIPAAPNHPPTVQLTFPTGTQANPTLVSLQPTVTWSQGDIDPGTIYSTFNLNIKDEWGNCIECIKNQVMDTPLTYWAWTMDNLLELGKKYSVQVQVSDGEASSSWSEVGWMATNSSPVATMTFPSGTQAAPSIVSTLRPTLTWTQTDPDPATVFHYFQLQITNEANNVMVLDSGKLWQGTSSTAGSWLVPSDLTAGQKLRVRVKVWDQNGSESPWSAQTWLYINRPPMATMTYPSGTEAAPTRVTTFRPTITWNQTDPDPNPTFTYFQIQITNEANTIMVLDSTKLWQGTTAASGSWTATSDLPDGQKLRVRVKVWDEFDLESGWSAQTWMYINRPPVAEFDWSPKPAYEGDAVVLVNLSTDPDGDPLTSSWQIEGPGYSSTQVTPNAAIPAAVTDHHPGDYIVTLTVTDPYGASDQVTKPVQVGDLQIQGFVDHTAQWDLNRKAYNRLKSGEEERPRPPQMFWSGEAFVLSALTNEPATQVQAAMSYTELRSPLASTDFTAWKAQMFRNDFESLPDKEYTFQFTAVWPNGHVEIAAVTITVSNPWVDFTSSVRKE
ncbi:glycoside hydrolase family 78 protein [Paenibacillus agricola]|uniref:PKD domain-containing protein n=1 Tax=Paenibacillus agricola TaxID=2716264 RepID=A0ABX0J2X9_9BACL|nr:PKD domain-containing protein [Paenibacillus agricola]NHN30186.1 hypothetical protein [Paenibacillus agricola]